jgi:hypothetical protein
MKPQFDLRDFYCGVGLIMLFAGLWRIYPPAAMILVGLIFLRLSTAKIEK